MKILKELSPWDTELMRAINTEGNFINFTIKTNH